MAKSKLPAGFRAKDFTSACLFKVYGIHDGDTISGELIYSDDLTRKSVHVRLIGLDSPEMGTQEPYASMSRDNLVKLITKNPATQYQVSPQNSKIIPEGVPVFMRTQGIDSKGRTLGSIYLTEEDLITFGGKTASDLQIEQKYAVAYDGKKARPVTDWAAVFAASDHPVPPVT